MDLDTFQPTFLIQIEGQAFSADITGEITSFIFFIETRMLNCVVPM